MKLSKNQIRVLNNFEHDNNCKIIELKLVSNDALMIIYQYPNGSINDCFVAKKRAYNKLLALGKEYLELGEILKEIAFIKDNNIKNRIFLKWTIEVGQCDSHRSTKRTKEEHLKFLEGMIKNNKKK